MSDAPSFYLHGTAGRHFVARTDEDGNHQVFVQEYVVKESTFGSPQPDQISAIRMARVMNDKERRDRGGM